MAKTAVVSPFLFCHLTWSGPGTVAISVQSVQKGGRQLTFLVPIANFGTMVRGIVCKDQLSDYDGVNTSDMMKGNLRQPCI